MVQKIKKRGGLHVAVSSSHFAVRKIWQKTGRIFHENFSSHDKSISLIFSEQESKI